MDDQKTLPGNGQNPLRTEVKHEGDRRIYARVPAISVTTKVKIKPTVLRVPDWESVTMIDYSQGGFAFISRDKFKLGQSIKIHIQLVIEETDITLKDIFGTIKSIALDGDTFRYGTEFDFGINDYMRSPHIQSKLSGIERVMKRAIARSQKDMREQQPK